MSTHVKGEKTGTCHTDKTVERKGGTGEGRQPPRSPHTQENANAQKALTKTPTKPLQCPMDQEHEESWRIFLSNKLLTVWVKRLLLVVHSIKLHLTALILRLAFVLDYF